MPDSRASDFGPVADARPGPPGAAVLVVCEHASNRIPDVLAGLGLPDAAQRSHVAWDLGALGVATALAQDLGAGSVTGRVSRLVYDCNRPPEAPDAIPARSEIYDIPGNTGLTPEQRQRRIDGVYLPFREALGQTIAAQRGDLKALITVHSFTPIYHGAARATEVGLLHGTDADLAQEMLAARPNDLPYRAELNAPYSAADGVTHTLDAHGAANALPSVMIEIRNDLIATSAAQTAMAAHLAGWIRRTLGASWQGAA